MIGRLYNKMRKQMREERESEAKAKLHDMSLVDKKLRDLWNTDEPIGSTRMVICACGHKRRWQIGEFPVTFKCSKCGGRQTLIR